MVLFGSLSAPLSAGSLAQLETPCPGGKINMKRSFLAVILLVCVLTTLNGADQPNPQTAPVDKAQMAEKVRQEFLLNWNAYKKYGWGHDMFKPLSRGHCDWHEFPLYLSAVDAMDTLYLMGFKKEGDEAREFVATNLSFDHDIHVKNYEMVIRIMGGLLSTYQITGDKRLLALAEDEGNRLLPVFKSETGMPYTHVDFKTGAVQGEISNPTEIGSMLLELGTLSKLTGKPIYYDKAKRAMVELYNRRSPLGLIGSTMNVRTGKWIDPADGFSNFHKTMLKCQQLFGDKDCEQMWHSSITA